MSKPCPVSRDEFLANAKAIKITVNGQDFWAEPREFSTGGFGWNVGGKAGVQLDGGKLLHLQLSCNASVIGSKDAPRTTPTADPVA